MVFRPTIIGSRISRLLDFDFSVKFTTKNEIIHESWRQIYISRLLVRVGQYRRNHCGNVAYIIFLQDWFQPNYANLNLNISFCLATEKACIFIHRQNLLEETTFSKKFLSLANATEIKYKNQLFLNRKIIFFPPNIFFFLSENMPPLKSNILWTLKRPISEICDWAH